MKNKINYISIFLMFFGTILVISSLFLKNSNNSFSINFKTSEYFKNNDRVTKEVKNIEEIKKYGRDNILKFDGTIASYGGDCEGCSGYLSCPPHINAKNTIYYSDKKYKNLRIVKIKGIKNYKDIYAIVLDRGGAIKGTLFDLLLDKEKSANSIGRQVVKYEILRWGWNNES